MLEAGLLGLAAKLSSEIKHVGHQWTSTHLSVADFGVLAMFRTQDPQALAVCAVRWVVEVTEHVVPVNPGLVYGPK